MSGRRRVVGALLMGGAAALLWRGHRNAGQPALATSRGRRNAQAARLAAGVGTTVAANRARRVFASAARKEALDAELELRTAEQVAATLGQMKGALMKAGQLASFVDDGMPEPMREALSQLQQDAPPMSAELAAGMVEAELGAAPDRVFADWDRVPIAAASIGQVHRAMTRDGRAVAVKVQYPGIAAAMEADLSNLDLLGLTKVLWRSLDIEGMAEEVRARLIEELDYEHEADNQRLFASWYRGHPFIHVPDVIDELSTRRVLTMELADGVRFDEVEGWDQAERDLAAEAIYRFVYRSFYRFHGFNGDPHPGNYLFRPGGRVTFLDFGLVRRYSPEQVHTYLAPIRARVFTPDDTRALRVAEETAGWLVPGAPVTDEQVVAYTDLFWTSLARDAPFTMTAEYATDFTRTFLFDRERFGDVLKWMAVPPAFAVLQRINLGLIAILGRLNATGNWRAIAEELWPFTDRSPSTALGREEAGWWARARPAAPCP